MASGLVRVLEPETLDHLPADDPRAVRSRRDLVRINAIMGARRLLERAMHRACPAFGSAPLRVVELGCGDGALLLDVARRMPAGSMPVELVLLDRQPIVAPATLAAYAAAGWRAQPLRADVLDWARDREGPTSWSPTCSSTTSTRRRWRRCSPAWRAAARGSRRSSRDGAASRCSSPISSPSSAPTT
jgi:hypothetical protein